MYKLIIEDDEGHTTVVPLVKDEITIGRKEGNTIRLTERNVSRHHARLIKNNGSVFIEDLDSYNGVKVNGDKITARTTIREGDLVEIGDYHFALQWVGEDFQQKAPAQPGGIIPVPASSGEAATPAAVTQAQVTTSPGTPPATPGSVPSQSDGATAVLKVPVDDKKEDVGRVREIPDQKAGQLVITTTELSGQQFKLNQTEMILGRTEDCEVCLPHRSVSSRHAKIVYDGGIYRILDLDSANGVLVNGEEYSRVDLRRGDMIELGHVRIRYMAPGDVYQPQAEHAVREDGRTLVDAAAVEEDEIRVPGGGKKFAWIAVIVVVLGAGAFAAYHFATVQDSSTPAEPEVGTADTPTPPKEDPAAVDFRDGVAKLENRFLDAAEAAFVAAREKNPDYPGLDKMQEKVRTEKKYAQVFADLQKAIVEKNHDEAWHLINEIPADSLYAKDVVDIKPEVRKNYIAMHLRKAEKYKEAGVFDKAIKHVDEVLIEKPDDAVAMKLKRQIQRMQKARNKPPPDDRVAVRPDPGRKVRKDGPRKKRKESKEQVKHGMDLERSGRLTEAIASYRKALAMQPTNCDAHLRLGAVYAKTGDRNRAEHHYRKFVEICPKHMVAPRVRHFLKQFEAYKKNL